MTFEAFPHDIIEAMSICALRFNGYKYEESLGPTESTGERLQEMITPIHDNLTLHQDLNQNFGAFFSLRRWLHKWGGECLTKYSVDHTTYDFLFLHLYRIEVPQEFCSEEYNLRWKRECEPRQEEIASFVRNSFQRKGLGRISFMEPSRKMTMNQQEIEIASWRMVTELHRRHPSAFSIIEMHPGGGQYDCLSLLTPEGTILALLNRAGSFQAADKDRRIEHDELWTSENTHGHSILSLVDRMCGMIQLPVPATLPATSPQTLVYRFVSAFLAHAYCGLDFWERRSGYLDSSGWSCEWRREWFDPFPSTRDPLRIAEREKDLTGFGFS